MKRILSIVLILITVTQLYAKEGDYTSYLVGDDKGKIYYSHNIDEMHPLASVTKMVNLMVVYDEIKKGTIKLSDKVTISEEARLMGGSRIWMGKGVKISVEELIKATAIHSANNAAYALAEYVGRGSVDRFIELMNKKSKDIGAEVVFDTPMGLPPYMTGRQMDEGTARGIYLLSLEALKYKEYMKIASMKEATIQRSQVIKNRNKLLSILGIYGIKTGHHDTAGYNIAIASKSKGRNIITVVFGSPDEKTRDNVVMEQIKKFYAEYKMRNLISKSKPIKTVEISRGVKDAIEIYPERNYSKLLGNKANVEIKTIPNKMLVAPIVKGEDLGEYKVIVDGEVVEKGRFHSNEDVEKENILKEVLKDIFN